MNGDMNANSNFNDNITNNRSSSSNGGFNISNLFDLSKLGNMLSGGTRGNNPLNNIRRMFGRNNINSRYSGNRNMLKVLPIEEAYRKIKSGGILLIDVRTEMEYATLKIKGSVNIPLDKLQAEIVNMVSNKNENIMLYCATGSRVRRAAQILWSLGYNNLYIWEGAGINTFAFQDLIVYNRGQQEE